MDVGIGVADITPPLGACLQGHFNRREASGVHDPLYARAFVFAQGETRVALVGCDLIGMPKEIGGAVRERVTEHCGIPGTHVMIWGTHTHAGPTLLQFGGDERGDERDETYVGLLVSQIAGTVAQACGELRARDVSMASGEARGIAHNRRYLMRDGSIRTNPGVGHPDILRPQGPTDTEVGCLFVGDGGAIAGAFVNFACHLDVLGSGNTLISADYAYWLEETFRAGVATDAGAEGAASDEARPAVVLFGNGACGDINHIDVHARDRQGGFEHSRRMGQVLGGEALRCLQAARPVDAAGACTPPEDPSTLGGVQVPALQPALAARSVDVPLPYREFSEEELASFRRTLAESATDERSFARLNAQASLARHEGGVTTYAAEVQALRLGDAVVVGLPAEYFVEFGLDIKQRSAAAHTFVVELANDYIGYVPTPAALAAGGYEGNSARFSAEAGPLMADAAVALTEALFASGEEDRR